MKQSSRSLKLRLHNHFDMTQATTTEAVTPAEPAPVQVNLDGEIAAVQMQIAFWQGKLEVLQAFKRAGATIHLPEAQASPEASAQE